MVRSTESWTVWSGPTARIRARRGRIGIVSVRLNVTLDKVRRRLQSAPASAYLRGALLRPKFTRAGLLTIMPGQPRVQITNRGGQIICENIALFPGVRLECQPGARIVIGNGTYLNRNTEVIAASSVSIGRDCMISWDVIIMDTHQHGLGGQPPVVRPVTIGDGAWIGARAIVLPGVTIGECAVIGAGAVVTKDVPPRTVVAGNPARVIRTL